MSVITNTKSNKKITGTSGNDSIGNKGNKVTINGGAGNDYIQNIGGANVSIYGGAGNDTLTGGKGNDVFIYSAGNDVITDYATGDKISLGAAISQTSLKGSDATFTIGKNILTVKNGKGKKLAVVTSSGKTQTIIGGALIVTKNSTLESWREVGDASALTKAVKVAGNAKNNTLYGGSKNDTLSGAAGNDKLYGNAGNDSLSGGDGADTLSGGAGNDTLTGGKGNDVFIYSAGNDFITDYATGDKISLGAAISQTSLKGSDATFTIGKNILTVKNDKGKKLAVVTSSGKTQTIIGGALIVTKNSTLESWREVGDASSLTKAVKLTGNAKNNTLLGGSNNDSLYGAAGNDKLYGGKGNDTLTGGKGNDSLWGDAGKDTFLYSDGDGKDIITGFANDDMLKITGTFSNSYNKSKKEVYFKVGSTSNAITLKDFSATSFNVNGTNYKISGSKLVKK